MKKWFFLILIFAMKARGAELILNSESTFNPSHNNRFSAMMGMGPNLLGSERLSQLVFSYGRKFEGFWFDANAAITSGPFHKFSANNSAATNATAEQLADQKNSLTSVGAGIGYETRYVQTLLPFDDLYEFIAADLTYSVYKENFSGKSFSGPGLLAKISAYKRFGDYFSFGAHFNYNLAVVQRSKETDAETNSQRSLTLGFLTVGLDLSFYL